MRAGLPRCRATAGVIAVHDGARPLFSRHVFERCLAALDDADGAVPGVEVSDTLKQDRHDRAVESDRRPQRPLGGADAAGVPRRRRCARCTRATTSSAATDDAALLERAGYKVVVVPSTPANVKITTPADLPLAGALLSWEVEADV